MSSEQALHFGDGERLRRRQGRELLELGRNARVDGVEPGIEAGDRRTDRLRRLGVGRAHGGEQALVLTLSPADQILPLAHDLRERPVALGEAHRHLGERIGGIRLQRPLRQLEALIARSALLPAERCTARAEARRVHVLSVSVALESPSPLTVGARS